MSHAGSESVGLGDARPLRFGRYELACEIAAGGMGVVFLARQIASMGIERLVVVKRLRGLLAAGADFKRMFVEEARLGTLVRHANVVPVVDVVEEENELLLVMEYVESVSLAVLLRRL